MATAQKKVLTKIKAKEKKLRQINIELTELRQHLELLTGNKKEVVVTIS